MTRQPVRLPMPGLLCLSLAVGAGRSVAQDGEPRQPGTLDKAYEALVGDGTEVLRVDQPEVEEPRSADPPPALTLESGTWYFDSILSAEQYGDLDPRGASGFQVRRSAVALRAYRPGEGGAMLGASARFEATGFEFDDLTSIAPGVVEPTGDVFEGELSLFRRGDSTGDWYSYLSASLSAAGESEAEFGDSLSYEAVGTVAWRLDDDLAVVVGGLFRTALEDDPLILPILGVDWTIDERSRVRTTGPSIEYARELTPSQSIFARLAFQSREYRLDGLGPVPGAALSDRELRLATGLEFRPGLHERIGLSDSVARIWIGSVLQHDLTFHDVNENELFSVDQDPTLLIGASLSLTF